MKINFSKISKIIGTLAAILGIVTGAMAISQNITGENHNLNEQSQPENNSEVSANEDSNNNSQNITTGDNATITNINENSGTLTINMGKK